MIRFALVPILFATLLGCAGPAWSQAPVERIGIIGCYRQTDPEVALARYVDLAPDVVLWVGDNVYVDTDDDPGAFWDAYRTLAERPAFAPLRQNAVFLPTWDDHDYGNNNEDRRYALKDTSRHIFRRFWGLETAIPEDRPGVYHARRFASEAGTLQVILLDVRYHRDAPGPTADVLGEPQWAWLEEQLRAPADLRLIVSGSQVLLDAESGSETWAAYPQARTRLFDTIRRAQAERVVFITGDQHYAEVARLRGALDVDAVELQFAALNQIESPEFSTTRVSPVATSTHTYAWIDVQWRATETDPPHLTYRVADAETGQIELTYRVNFDELALDVRAKGPRVFWPTGTVTLTHPFPDLELRYTRNATSPGPEARPLDGPLTLTETTVLTTQLYDASGFARSAPRTFRFERQTPLPPVSVDTLRPGLRYRYYEGTFTQLPTFALLTPRRSGVTESLAPTALAERDDHYALRFDGYVEVPETALYTFEARSDDGSRVLLHDQLVVDNDGSHSARTRTGAIALEAGLHPIRIDYFEDYAGQSLTVGYRRGDGPLTPIAPERIYHRP